MHGSRVNLDIQLLFVTFFVQQSAPGDKEQNIEPLGPPTIWSILCLRGPAAFPYFTKKIAARTQAQAIAISLIDKPEPLSEETAHRVLAGPLPPKPSPTLSWIPHESPPSSPPPFLFLSLLPLAPHSATDMRFHAPVPLLPDNHRSKGSRLSSCRLVINTSSSSSSSRLRSPERCLCLVSEAQKGAFALTSAACQQTQPRCPCVLPSL